MPGEVGDYQLVSVGGGDDDVHLLEDLGDFANGQCAGAVGLDVFDGRVEAGYAKGALGQSSWPCSVSSLSRPVMGEA